MFNSINYPPKRDYDYSKGKINADIDAHVDYIPNQYQNKSDLINSVHESSHFLNSSLRNQFKGKAGFYLLNNQAILLDIISKPTIREIAGAIPKELQGISYHLYLIQSAASWNSFPLYLFDELSAYINGAAAGIEAEEDCWSEILQAYEFSLYTAVLARMSQDQGVIYLQKLQLKRVKALYNEFRGNKSRIDSYILKWQNDPNYRNYLNCADSVGNSEFL